MTRRNRRIAGVILVGMLAGGCTTLSPLVPRFVLVFEQRHENCRVQIVRDTKTQACFAAWRCVRQPIVVLLVDISVCEANQ